jgi:hypothetical protein
MGGLLAGAASVIGAPLIGRGAAAAQGEPEPIEIEAQPILSFTRTTHPGTSSAAALTFRGGVQLQSPASEFGGWSGLIMEEDGSRLLAVSDRGSWLSADVGYDHGRVAALRAARLGTLRSADGEPLRGKRQQDAEAVALLAGNLTRGSLLIAFERQHRIGCFPVRDGEVLTPTHDLKLPAEARRMRPNQGIEALAVLRAGPRQGSVVAFAERLSGGSGQHTGWIWLGGQPQSFTLSDIDGFDITDAVGLPDGGLLVLERFFRWREGVKLRLRRLLPGEIEPGARLSGSTLLEADASFEIDNMEGIAAHRGARGETVLSLISDDNFNPFLQRTILLQFALAEA